MSQKNPQNLHTNYDSEMREPSGQIWGIVCDISIPPSKLATLKDTGRIRAEPLRGSEDGVVGEGEKSLNERGPFSLGNKNKDTKRTTNTVKHFVCTWRQRKELRSRKHHTAKSQKYHH